MTVVTRFPPSPTGYLHLGGARTALFNWLYAHKTCGKMVLRIEDTDLERSTPEAVQAILDGMQWLGLKWDDGPYYQTKRFDRYDEVIAQLLAEDKAYYCQCSRQTLDDKRAAQQAAGEKPRYDHTCRDLGLKPGADDNWVVRFKNPLDGDVLFEDVVKGNVTISNAEMDDLIIARSDGTPTYNLTVVVDDIDMGITHVIRGDDHTNNTPRQINIFRALGAELPVFSHVPMILGSDGQKLSKRHGAVSVLAYRDMGILPEALLNYLVRLGWSHGDQEIFSIDQMIELFDIKDINKSAASFNLEKLHWINQHYIKEAGSERLQDELAQRLNKRGIALGNGPKIADVVEVLRDRVQDLEQMADQASYFFEDFEQYDANAAKKHLRPVAADIMTELSQRLESLDHWQAEVIEALVGQVAEDAGVGMAKVGLPLRVAISGTAATPSIGITVALIGKQRVLNRLQSALEFIRKRAENNA